MVVRVLAPMLLGAAASGSSASGGTKRQMPSMPRSYIVMMEINRVNSLETINVHQYLDFENQRVRTDLFDGGGSKSMVRDFGTGTQFSLFDPNVHDDVETDAITNKQCTLETLSLTGPGLAAYMKSNGMDLRPAFTAATLHMKNPNEVYLFRSDGKERYVGLDYARGIHTTQWYANSTETEMIDGHKITTNAKRNHWFSTAGWSDSGCKEDANCGLEIPVRTVSEGTVFNHTTGKTEKFHDHYEYISFVPGTPAPGVFHPEVGVPCVPGPHVDGPISKLPGMTDMTIKNKKTIKSYDSSKGMPKLYNQYTVYMEINKVNSKETINVKEYFDFDFQHVRTDIRDGGKMITTIENFQTGVKYTLTDDDLKDDNYLSYSADNYACVKEPLNRATSTFAAKTRHMKNPQEVFSFSSTGDEKYVGLDYARGIHTTQWYAAATEDVTDPYGHTITLTTKRNHWFAAPDWSDANCDDCVPEVPIRTVSEGSALNHTTGVSTPFHDHYEYVAFLPGKPPVALFSPPPGSRCVDKAAVPPKTMPKIPDEYIVMMEINRVETLETINVKEYFDLQSQRVRTDMYDGGALVSYIKDFGKGRQYVLVDGDVQDDPEVDTPWDDKCTREPLTPSQHMSTGMFGMELQGNSMDAKTLHLRNPNEVHMFSSDGREQYVGLDYARGIHCTQWYADSVETQIVDGHELTVTAKRNHWFSTTDWADANCPVGRADCMLQLPVRTVSEGTVFNHTTGKTEKFHDHYEYISFIPGAPPDYLYKPEQTMECAERPEGDAKAAKLFALPSTDGSPKVTKDSYNASAMPEMPEQYTVYVEINKVDSKETISQREYFDLTNGRIRSDTRDGNQMVSVIRDYNKGMKYTLIDDDLSDNAHMSFESEEFKCYRQKISDRDMMIAGDTRHTRDPSNVFMFTQDYEKHGREQFVGLDYARGVHCTQWYKAANENQVDAWGHMLTIKSKRNHWFQAPDWSDAYCDGCKARDDCEHACLEIPIRTVSEGTVLNHTTGKTEKFHDHYEYVAFLPGRPPRDLYNLRMDGFKDSDCEERAPGVDLLSKNPAGTPVKPMVSAASPAASTMSVEATGPSGGSSGPSGAKIFGGLLLTTGCLVLAGVAFYKLRQERSELGVSRGNNMNEFGSGTGLTPTDHGGGGGYGRTGSREILQSSPDSSAI